MTPFEDKRVALWGPPEYLESECPDKLVALAQTLSRLGCRVYPVRSIGELLETIEGSPVDLIFAMLCGCFRQPLELLAGSERGETLPPVVLVTTAFDVALYLEAMWRGAFDCVAVPLDEKELIRIATRALNTRCMRLTA